MIIAESLIQGFFVQTTINLPKIFILQKAIIFNLKPIN